MGQVNNNRVCDINKFHTILTIIFQVDVGHKVTKEIRGDWSKKVRKVLWTRKGVCTTVVTASQCTHAELTSGHALASRYSCCMHSRVYAN